MTASKSLPYIPECGAMRSHTCLFDRSVEMQHTGTGYKWISYAVGLLTFSTVALANCICACALYRLAAPRLGLPLPAGMHAFRGARGAGPGRGGRARSGCRC